MIGRGALSVLYRSIDKFFTTTTQKKSTQCIIFLLFLLFSQINMEGAKYIVKYTQNKEFTGWSRGEIFSKKNPSDKTCLPSYVRNRI